MKTRVKLWVRVLEIVLLVFLTYQMYLLFQKDSKQIEEEYKDGKLFLFLLVGAFLSTLFEVIRTNFAS